MEHAYESMHACSSCRPINPMKSASHSHLLLRLRGQNRRAHESKGKTAMDLVQAILNLTLPPMGFAAMMFLLPTVLMIRSLGWMFGAVFKEPMRNKVVIITGASSGIGQEMSFEYARKGAVLVLAARRVDRLHKVADKCLELGSPCVRVIGVDVSKEEDCKRMVDNTVQQFGCIHHLVNNAGIASSFLFEEVQDTSALSKIMDVDFWGYVYPTYYALPHLKSTGGRIVVTASSTAWMPMPRMAIYNAAKSAVVNFFDSLRTELGPTVGITVVTPGWIESEINKGKFMNKEGEMTVSEVVRDIQGGPIPVAYAADCAKAIVDGACRGRRSVCFPRWCQVVYIYRLLVPELLEWLLYLVYVYQDSSSRYPLSKTVLDATGAKNLLYPSSIRHSWSAYDNGPDDISTPIGNPKTD